MPAPVYFENDTALVGLGEAHYGSGQGSEIFVYVTVSTGVNGVRVVHGRIDASTQGFEIGGQYLNLGNTTSWEEIISGTAIQKRFGVPPKELGKGNAIWEELAETMAFGLHNTILHWSPDRVAIGGSMLNEIGISVERVSLHLKRIMRKFPKVPDIVHSQLKDVGGLYGGLARLSQLARET
jgi:predicted NBD/HSP70 family sugar kinase